MALTKTEYRDYIFNKADDQERQVIQHRVFRSAFIQLLNQLLDDYRLVERIEEVNRAGYKFKILDFGCGEGLFLHDVAEVLEKRNLQDKVAFFGIDLNELAIITATDYSKYTNPPRPYLHYYVHDALNPLEAAWELFVDGRKQFDFIFAIQVIEHICGAQERLQELYNYLAPGGILYVRDLVLHMGEDGWKMPHSALNIFSQAYSAFVAKTNNGLEVASANPQWLTEMGATVLSAELVKFPVGGTTSIGRDNLRNVLMGASNAGVSLVAGGMMTQAQLDGVMQTLFRELTPEYVGQLSYVDTLARKPLEY